jgi:serine phosphatase RsbU (regulator of sigma subunit)
MIEKKIARADLILNEARKDIIKSLNPTGSEESKDGMDCILACFDFENLKLEYAAANNSFYIVRNNEMIICKADKMPVGKSPRDEEPFTLHTVDLQKGDTVYMLTDGLPDQFGGPKGKKFKYKQLEDLLMANTKKPLTEQKEILNASFHNWKGSLEQVDDVLLIGIKI